MRKYLSPIVREIDRQQRTDCDRALDRTVATVR